MMKRKITTTVCSALLGLGALTLAVANDAIIGCGPLAESSVWLIDYSGTMQEKFAKDFDGNLPQYAKDKEEIFKEFSDTKKIVLANDLLQRLLPAIPQEANLVVAAGTLAPHTLPIRFGDDVGDKLTNFPQRLEVFGRMTNLGEGLDDFVRRIHRAVRTNNPEKTRGVEKLAEQKSVLLILTDGEAVNRGRPIEEGFDLLKHKYPNIRPVLLTFNANGKARENIRQVVEEVPGLVTADAMQLLLDDSALSDFVTKVFYRACPEFDLTLDVHFDFDQSALRHEDIAKLKGVVDLMHRQRKAIDELGVLFEITSHTDRFGSLDYNDRLSQKRLQTVLAELEKLGADMSLFVIRRAEGKSRPVTGQKCRDEQGYDAVECLQPDRRVEIRITQKRRTARDQ